MAKAAIGKTKAILGMAAFEGKIFCNCVALVPNSLLQAAPMDCPCRATEKQE